MNATDKLIETFASKLRSFGVRIREEDNKTRLEALDGRLPKRLPQSFASFLSRYSFPTFDVAGILGHIRHQYRVSALRGMSHQSASERHFVLEMDIFVKAQRETMLQLFTRRI